MDNVSGQGKNVIESAVALMPEPVFNSDGRKTSDPFVLLPDGNGRFRVEDLSKFADPKRADDRTFSDVRSFTEYVKRFKTSEMQIFANAGGVITAIFDYLPAPDAADVADAKEGLAVSLPGARMLHKVSLRLSPHKQFERWRYLCNKPVRQFDFAEFLDENFADVVKPSGADLLEVAMTLQANIESSFKSAKRLKDGAGTQAWTVEVRTTAGAAGQLEVPELIALNVPLWTGAPAAELSARLRIRISDGAAVFTLLPNRWDDLVRTAFDAVCADIAKETGVAVYQCA